MRAAAKPPSIHHLAAELIARREAGEGGATVILGAGASIKSGIATWPQLAEIICRDFHIDHTDSEPVRALVDYFNRPTVPYNQRHTIFQRYLRNKAPSLGYSHLAQLIRDGLVSVVLTTNWDSLLETALFRMIPFDGIKVLIRGELPDDLIAEILAWRRQQPTVVKLHGDTLARRFLLGDAETRRFGKALTERLAECVSGCTFMVGQSAQDADILGILLSAHRSTGALYHVRHDEASANEIDKLVERASAQVIQGHPPSVLADGVNVNIGDFDTFFSQLDLAVQQQLTEKRRPQLRKAEASILDKEKTGVGYVNYTRITELVQLFAFEVRKAAPDLILFIDDPSAPGGLELRRKMLPIMKREGISIPSATIRIEGQSGSRTHRRAVTSDLTELPLNDAKKVLILDSITFSGNTLALARASLKASWPHLAVQLGVLVISNQLYERQKQAAELDPAERYLSQVVTDRYEIFFPWGVTQTTSTFDRTFEGATEEGRRHVTISKRPWGTIEVLVDQELTSVRLLTIEAGRKLSFQRHLCRDELFVALDDNIGLDICAEELDRDSTEYDEHVKSLILEKGDYVLVPRGVWHRTKASMDRVRLLEVGFGLYDQDYDIERRWDDYERERRDGRI